MRINQNIAAFNAYRNLNNTQTNLSSSLEKLSSGFRINRAADDASGLVNSENLRSRIGGLKVATRNAQDAISLVQTAEGAQTEVHSILQRMRDLAVEAGNTGTNDATSLQANQDEIRELQKELNRINSDTQFGSIDVFTDFQETAAVDTIAADVAVLGTANAITTDNNPTSASAATGDASQLTLGFAEGFASIPEGYDGQITLTVGGGGLASAGVTVDVAFDASAADVAAAVNGLAGISAVVDGDDIVITTDDNSAAELTFTAVTQLQEAREAGQGAQFQIGANENQTETLFISGVSAELLEVDDIDVTTDAGAAITAIDAAIQTVSENRAELGAFQNRMESLTRNLSVAVENLSAAESRIRDTDMALEMVEFTRNQILSQAGTAMLAQANTVPQSVLSLLG